MGIIYIENMLLYLYGYKIVMQTINLYLSTPTFLAEEPCRMHAHRGMGLTPQFPVSIKTSEMRNG